MILYCRSLLFVATDNKAWLAKMIGRGADAVILDLEDAVPDDGRRRRAELCRPVDALARGGHPVVVRINAVARCNPPFARCIRKGVAAIVAQWLKAVGRRGVIADMVTELSVIAGPPRVPGLIALIESPAGLGGLKSIAAVPEVLAMPLGSEDFSLASGVPPTKDALDLPCSMRALAAARRGLIALGLPILIATIDDLPASRMLFTRLAHLG